MHMTTRKPSCGPENVGPGVVKVKFGTTSANTARETMTLRYALAPRRL
jgi:hypothetical protein